MGINNLGERCGSCFVIFETHRGALRALECLSRKKLDNQVIRMDIDPGYIEGKEKGRGQDGDQKRDNFRSRDVDKSRNKNNENRGNFEKK